MSDFVTGEVQFMSKSPKGFHSLKVDDVWYGYGMQAPKCDKGNDIAFSYTAKGDFKMIDSNTLEVTSVKTAVSGGGGSKSASSRDQYWEDKAKTDVKQQRIREYHAARGTAVEVATLLVESGAVKLPQAEAKKYDAIVAVVDELTGRFVEDISNRFYDPADAMVDDAKAEEE